MDNQDKKAQKAELAARTKIKGEKGTPVKNDPGVEIHFQRKKLADKVSEAFQKGLKDKARGLQNKNPGTSNFTAVQDAARAEGDSKVKKAQGKNTPRSVFGGKSNQDSATAAGGTVGKAANRTPPESEHSMNRRKPADQESIKKKTDAQGKVSGAFYQAAGGNKRAQKQANRTMLANKLKSKFNR